MFGTHLDELLGHCFVARLYRIIPCYLSFRRDKSGQSAFSESGSSKSLLCAKLGRCVSDRANTEYTVHNIALFTTRVSQPGSSFAR